jgi:8-amino-7-oxononanoate synthase
MERIISFLQKREETNTCRVITPGRVRKNGMIYVNDNAYHDFSSNDYLGFSHLSTLEDVAKQTIDEYGIGSGASRLLSADVDIFHDLEKEVAAFKGTEDALIFNTGYAANVGMISALGDVYDLIITDKLCHASIIDGVKLAGVKHKRFSHNDMHHLEQILEKYRSTVQKVLIITESVFSMDGDRAPLMEIVRLAKQYSCEIMVDEAHATGLYGHNGAGLVNELGLTHDVAIIMGTFSKALGSYGAYAACSTALKNYFVNTARSFIYSTALPPTIIAVNRASIVLIKNDAQRRAVVHCNAQLLRTLLLEQGYTVSGESPIVPLIIGNSNTALNLSEQLQEKGYWVKAVRPPTVPEGTARLRFTVTHDHSEETIRRLVDDITTIYSV